jgi:hypothetical protein
MISESPAGHVSEKSYSINVDRVMNGWIVRCGYNVFVIQHTGMDDFSDIFNTIQSMIRRNEGDRG